MRRYNWVITAAYHFWGKYGWLNPFLPGRDKPLMECHKILFCGWCVIVRVELAELCVLHHTKYAPAILLSGRLTSAGHRVRSEQQLALLLE